MKFYLHLLPTLPAEDPEVLPLAPRRDTGTDPDPDVLGLRLPCNPMFLQTLYTYVLPLLSSPSASVWRQSSITDM